MLVNIQKIITLQVPTGELSAIRKKHSRCNPKCLPTHLFYSGHILLPRCLDGIPQTQMEEHKQQRRGSDILPTGWCSHNKGTTYYSEAPPVLHVFLVEISGKCKHCFRLCVVWGGRSPWHLPQRQTPTSPRVLDNHWTATERGRQFLGNSANSTGEPCWGKTPTHSEGEEWGSKEGDPA